MIVFLHANGLPSRTYNYLFECLQPLEVIFPDKFPDDTYRKNQKWASLIPDLIAWIEENCPTPPTVVGHSLGGGLAWMAAQNRPDLFRQLILLDSPLFGPWRQFLFRFGRLTGYIDRVPPMSLAKNRRRSWSSREEAEAYFSSKSFFQSFHPKCFADYIRYGLSEQPDGSVVLEIPPEVEYGIFYDTPVRLGAHEIDVPNYYVHAANSVLSPADMRWLRRRFRSTSFVPGPPHSTHMFPLEQPEATAELIQGLVVREEDRSW